MIVVIGSSDTNKTEPGFVTAATLADNDHVHL
jgi:hypothetical protein